eukprot:2434036-Pleurochrysis_carterae.AAC.3
MPPVHNASLMERMCEQSIDFRWLFHFLHGVALLYWDMRQAVRSNQSEGTDLIWRECVPFMHIENAYKTQYASMALLDTRDWGKA